MIHLIVFCDYPYSVFQAFRKLDRDGDGQISEKEFIEGVGGLLKLALPLSITRAIFHRVRGVREGAVQYHDFLAYMDMKKFEQKVDSEAMSDQELIAILTEKRKSIICAFEAMDIDGNCSISPKEV